MDMDRTVRSTMRALANRAKLVFDKTFHDHRDMPGDAKRLVLDGVPTILTGLADDPYFQTIEDRIRELSKLANFYRTNVAARSTVVDVGANIGLSTILLSRMADRVMAFEASPKNAAFLKQNLRLNNITNTQVFTNAVSDIAGVVRLHEAQFGAGSHVVLQGHVAEERLTSVDVECLTLDSLHLPPISFMKIDVEGHEPNVLSGAKSLLERDSPLVFMEINAWCLSAFAGHSLGSFVRTLWKHFDVSTFGSDGSAVATPDAYGFLHDLLVKNGGLSDVVLRPKPDVSLPTLRALTWPEAAIAAFDAPSSQPDGPQL